MVVIVNGHSLTLPSPAKFSARVWTRHINLATACPQSPQLQELMGALEQEAAEQTKALHQDDLNFVRTMQPAQCYFPRNYDYWFGGWDYNEIQRPLQVLQWIREQANHLDQPQNEWHVALSRAPVFPSGPDQCYSLRDILDSNPKRTVKLFSGSLGSRPASPNHLTEYPPDFDPEDSVTTFYSPVQQTLETLGFKITRMGPFPPWQKPSK